MNGISVKSTIELTEEQVKQALMEFLSRNSVGVKVIHSIREKTGGGMRDEVRVGFTLEVELGSVGHVGPTYRTTTFPDDK
jgi:hypothetical protein